MPVSPISHVVASPQIPANTFTTLEALDRLFHPNATVQDALLGQVIRTMSRYIRVDTTTAGEDLSLLLAVSIALERAAGRPGR